MDTITEDLCMDLKEIKMLIKQHEKAIVIEKDLLDHYIDTIMKIDTNHINVTTDVDEMNHIANIIVARKERIGFLKKLYKEKKKMHKKRHKK